MFIIAIGKASIAMTRAAIEQSPVPPADLLVAYPRIEPEPSGFPAHARLIAAGHPVPDAGSMAAGAAVIEMLRDTRREDLVLVLVSGGGSALCEALPSELSLAQVADLTQSLQLAGADIHELNTVRRTLSLLKGGGLARLAYPARVIALLLSDVLGDDPATIASGPTVASRTSPVDARAVLERYGLRVRFPEVWNVLQSGLSTGSSDSLLARSVVRDSGRTRSRHIIVGSNARSAFAVRDEARRLGFHAQVSSLQVSGEARAAGHFIGGMVRSVRLARQPFAAPACLVFGGETTVTVVGQGRGGRNQELALGAVRVLDGLPDAALFAMATDGVDGPTDAAGAWVTGRTASHARDAGLSIDEALSENNAYPVLDRLGALWKTGPSGTNVMDLAIALIY